MSTEKHQHDEIEARDQNRDPLTGAPGSHPVGVGLGGAAGGVAAGALAGTVFGPIGTLIGAAAGVIAGAAAGKGVAERIDPTVETEYWRNEYERRPYYRADRGYDYDRDYITAYGFGLQAREAEPGRSWEEAETRLAQAWPTERGPSRLEWEDAQPAARDAWERADQTYQSYADRDAHFSGELDRAGYRDPAFDYDDYRPAYRYGTQSRDRHAGRAWDPDLERELEQGWASARQGSRLEWQKAREAVREAFDTERFDGHPARGNPPDPRL
ncbi:MAG TPA: hypothetical protein VGC74_14615 [Stenotrophomonas sp.]|jgi:hypothetical protein